MIDTTLITLQKDKNYLEKERLKFLKTCSEIVECYVNEDIQLEGRPRFGFKDMLKSLLIMSFNGLSYRMVKSDLALAQTFGIISSIPHKNTLNKYMCDPRLKKELMRLIPLSAQLFIEHEDTLLVDSTWFGTKMYVGGYSNKPKSNKNAPPLSKTRKLHIGCLKESKIIAYARPSEGIRHDSPFFKEIVTSVVNSGFVIEKCIADAGYLSKDNYFLCQDLGIKGFIDFKSNVTGKHPKSQAYREAFNLYKNYPEVWHSDYRYRVLVESVFSSIKRKFKNWLRTRKDTARDNEMLLQALCYNITVIGRYSFS